MIRRAPWMRPALLRMLSQADREFVGDPGHHLRPYLPCDYLADGAPVGVDTVVHVEAAWQAKKPLDSVAETRWVVALPFGRNGTPTLGAIVAYADPTDGEVAQVLDAHLRASPLVRGIRRMAAHSPDPGVTSMCEHTNLLAEPAFLRGFAAIAERKLSFDVWVYGHQLPDVVILAREYPDTTFVLDHLATPPGALGPRGRHTGQTTAARRAIFDRWRNDISAVAALPNVVAKQSGFGMPVLGLGPVPRTRLRDAIAPFVFHVEDEFGSKRTFWSSNYPFDKPNVALEDGVWVLRQVLGDRLDEQAMFGDNARHVYRIAPPDVA